MNRTNAAAIVVTFNRKHLLKKCLDAILTQTKKLDKVYIIDNASTDGTFNFLDEGGYIKNEIVKYVLLSKNTGGAGGFNEGIKQAFNDGYEWFWLMDDDGYPDAECFDSLFYYKDQYHIMGPLIISTDCNFTTSFSYLLDNKYSNIVRDIISTLVISPVHPFNGTLINSDVVKEIGLPDKRFFIWGDEVDYRFKWLNSGFKESSITNARFYHPPSKVQFYKTNKYSLPLIILSNDERKYIYLRNKMYNYKYFNSSKIAKLITAIATIYEIIKYEKKWLFLLGAIYYGYIEDLDSGFSKLD